MVYLMSLIYILCILLYFCRLESKIYYKILCVILTLPVIFIDLVDMLPASGYIDTIRMYDEMHTLRRLGWEGLDEYNEAPLSKLYLYLISLLDINQLLVIITCLVVYFIILYMINKIGYEFKINNKIRCLSILYIVMSIKYISVTTNIRCPLSVAIFFCILMYDLIGQKNKIFCFAGYIISILIHPVTLVLLIIRILGRFSLKNSIVLISCLGFLCIIYWKEIPNIVLSFTDINIISGIMLKQQAYTNRAEDGTGYNILTIYWRMALLALDVLGFILSILLKKYLKPITYANSRILINIIILISIIDFILVVVTPESGGRLSDVILYVIAIYIYIISDKEKFKLSIMGYNNLKIIVKGLFSLWLIYFLYFNIYLMIKYFMFKYFI